MVKQYYLKEYTVVAMNENLIPIRIIYQPAGGTPLFDAFRILKHHCLMLVISGNENLVSILRYPKTTVGIQKAFPWQDIGTVDYMGGGVNGSYSDALGQYGDICRNVREYSSKQKEMCNDVWRGDAVLVCQYITLYSYICYGHNGRWYKNYGYAVIYTYLTPQQKRE
ncbi:hypothetical protein H8356DRAFT_1328459 [Neocallimastix lanati (nom. inval.)]|nr:hypothetical protein H8356DRAFT_1328459 [Neocallimastix sp. JGI-2020a]